MDRKTYPIVWKKHPELSEVWIASIEEKVELKICKTEEGLFMLSINGRAVMSKKWRSKNSNIRKTWTTLEIAKSAALTIGLLIYARDFEVFE